ncbi:cell division protein ZipA C-terminal FtsZ-binding domain-containing protein [Solimicrobium silvestre]|uniref:Cell division protein ZipA n=1 Tax=Solimicrobium silvestre TaxID=2099400 RepID=A0A2S9GUC1_9BURK|nr:cell division protein ZipA C-terminal FtsZ-binding domain-containing protein [Solimicrobium silvestre]PRC91332.1 ZipA, C-terminal FtsZ-binding domain [Solimicrobium silvestre]
MTDLNLSLWGAGCAVIVGVIGYNFWQEYKAKKNVERAFGHNQDDVLMKSDKQAAVNSGNSTTAKVRQEPSLDDNSTIQPSYHAESVDVDLDKTVGIIEVPLPVDDFIDCVIPMEFENPLRGDKMLSEIQSFRRVGNKPVHFIGINADGKREIITHANSYNQMIAGVQLVSRSGALNELEYSELVMKLREIADNLNAFPDIPDMKHVMDAGRDLHLFVTEHDAQLSVNVQSKGAPWGISTLLAALEKLGFDARPDGRLAMLDGDGGSLFTLSTNCGVADQVTSRITLLLDVPCVAPARGGFVAMVSCAKSLALRLGGSLVDDGNQLLNDATLDQIQEQVEVFYSAMQAAEIPAGSIRAVRIFS